MFKKVKYRYFFTKNLSFVVLTVSLFIGCKSNRLNNQITKKIETPFYNNQFTGLLVFNPETNDTVFSYNADKYFIPASNTKIFTLYSSLQFLPNKIPAFKYVVEEDTIILQGTGDPTFLHSYFNDSTALQMAKNFKHVKVVYNNLLDDKYGPGWAWEDYDTYFSPERSSFPIYGNTLKVSKTDSLQCTPEVLKQNVQNSKTSIKRAYNENTFYYNINKNDTIEIPFVINKSLIEKLWNAILPEKIVLIDGGNKIIDRIKYSNISTDSLYKRMMMESDNFLAEQMLILSSSTMSDTLSSKRVREYILNNQLKELKQKPRWVDGSGLSRYNLFTPTSFVQVLTKLHQDIPQKRLLNFFPIGGKTGTLKKNYSGIEQPYIYAKSGTVGNNYSLSGYLITKSKKTLIFSFMNNHYRNSTSDVKKNMESVLEWFRDHY